MIAPNSTQLLVSGAPSGTVTLQPLGLCSPGILPPKPPSPPPLLSQTTQQGIVHPTNQDVHQEIVQFTEASSPVTVVSLLLKHNSSSNRSVLFSSSNNHKNNNHQHKGAIDDPPSSSELSSGSSRSDMSNASPAAFSSSIFRGLYVAAGCEDGTVGVWDTDHLPLISSSSPSQGPGLGLGSVPKKGERTCLFCHQLRPTERF